MLSSKLYEIMNCVKMVVHKDQAVRESFIRANLTNPSDLATDVAEFFGFYIVVKAMEGIPYEDLPIVIQEWYDMGRGKGEIIGFNLRYCWNACYYLEDEVPPVV